MRILSAVMNLPASVRLSNANPSYPVFEIEHPVCSARVSLHGAHVMSWKPADEEEVLYLSPDAVLKEGKAIRGGFLSVGRGSARIRRTRRSLRMAW